MDIREREEERDRKYKNNWTSIKDDNPLLKYKQRTLNKQKLLHSVN